MGGRLRRPPTHQFPRSPSPRRSAAWGGVRGGAILRWTAGLGNGLFKMQTMPVNRYASGWTKGKNLNRLEYSETVGQWDSETDSLSY